jgi:hypothetical protein
LPPLAAAARLLASVSLLLVTIAGCDHQSCGVSSVAPVWVVDRRQAFLCTRWLWIAPAVVIGSPTEVTVPLVHALRAGSIFGCSCGARPMVGSAGSSLHGTDAVSNLSSASSTGSTASCVRDFTLWSFFALSTFSAGLAVFRCAGHYHCTFFCSSPLFNTRVVRACSFLFEGLCTSLEALGEPPSRGFPSLRWMFRSCGPSGPLPYFFFALASLFPHDAMRFVRFLSMFIHSCLSTCTVYSHNE